MAMEGVKASYERLSQSDAFRGKEEGSFLSSVSLMSDFNKLDKAVWQMDFFNPATKKILSFVMKENIQIKADQDMFQAFSVQELDVSLVKFEFDDAMKASETIVKGEFNDMPGSVIAVLQKRANLLWIITFVTVSMNVACIEINAENGDIVSKKCGSVMGQKV